MATRTQRGWAKCTIGTFRTNTNGNKKGENSNILAAQRLPSFSNACSRALEGCKQPDPLRLPLKCNHRLRGGLAGGLIHLLAQTKRPHIDPHLSNIVEAFRLGPFLSDGMPAVRYSPSLRPDRVLLFAVDHDGVLHRVFLLIGNHDAVSSEGLGGEYGRVPCSRFAPAMSVIF